MKNFKSKKSIFVMVLILTIAMTAFTGCGGDTVSTPIKIAALNGPTGMGMVQLMDMTDKYEITAYQAPTDAVAKVISGEADVAAVPSNLAAVLYNKTEGKVVAVSPIALGVLHILGNNVEITQISDLAGKTVVAGGKGGTPEYVLQKVLQAAGLTLYEDVQVEWLENHAEVNTKLLTEEGTIAMIPEPFVSTALSAGNPGVANLFDLNSLWTEATGQELPMGVLVAQKSFAEERADDLAVLLKDYKASMDFVNGSPKEAAELIVAKGFMGKEEIAEAAIPNCHIVLYTGDDAQAGRDMLKTFNETMFEMNPASVGGKLPGEDFYL